MKRAFVLCPMYDTPGRKDVSGAFGPESKAFIKTLNLAATLRLFDNNRAMGDRRKEVDVALERVAGSNMEVFAAFCHGWKDGVQFGYRIKDIPSLADRLVKACAPGVTIILYACDAARDSNESRADDRNPGPGGSGGFASELFMAMHKRGHVGCRVIAHSTEGHTTRNPYARVWMQDADLHNGDWFVDPTSDLFGKWRKELAGVPFPGFKYRFPFMTPAEVQAYLAK